MRILISSAGRRVELIECFRRAGYKLGCQVQLIACDCAPFMSPACQKADTFAVVPHCDDPTFLDAMLQLCEQQSIKILIPTIDTELAVFSKNRNRFHEIGTEVVVSSPDVVRIARNKLETVAFFKSIGFCTPRTCEFGKLRNELSDMRFPIIVRPIQGSSSSGLHLFKNERHLQGWDFAPDRYFAQEFWSGQEYTVNLFFDKQRLRCSVPHIRLETRGGEVAKAVTKRVPRLLTIAQELGKSLEGRAFGPLCFQAIVNSDGEHILLELNARFGGGYPLADHAGAPFAQWLIEIALGLDCSAHQNWRENVQMLRYDSSIFTEEARSEVR